MDATKRYNCTKAVIKQLSKLDRYHLFDDIKTNENNRKGWEKMTSRKTSK